MVRCLHGGEAVRVRWSRASRLEKLQADDGEVREHLSQREQAVSQQRLQVRGRLTHGYLAFSLSSWRMDAIV